ncbi:hypothetical protein KY289_026973 [Solanum tuberosum]|nr:hypothetical protein KY289_026973 [Solanum tuberosum]
MGSKEVVVHREREHHIYAVEGQDHLDGEMFHTVELVGNIEVQPWYSQKIIEMMLWFGFELGKEWIDWQPLIEGYYYPLRKLIPPLHQSFRSIGFMSSITDDVLHDMKGLSLTKEEEKSCNAVINEEEKGDLEETRKQGMPSTIGLQLYPNHSVAPHFFSKQVYCTT